MRKYVIVSGLLSACLANSAQAALQLFDVNATFDDGSVLTGSVDFDASKFSTDQWSKASFSLVGGDHFLRSFDVVDSLGGNISPARFTIGLGNFAIDNGTDPITTTSRVNLTFLIDPANIKGSNDGLISFTGAALLPESAIQDFTVIGPGNVAITETDLTVGAITAVPEPSSWAMMLVGICGLGFLAHRRRYAPAPA